VIGQPPSPLKNGDFSDTNQKKQLPHGPTNPQQSYDFSDSKESPKKKTKSSWSSQKIWTISTVSTGFFYRSNSPPTRLAVGHRSTLSVQLTDFTWWHQWKWGDHDLHDFRRHEKPVWGAKNPWILGFPIEKPPSTHQSCQLSCQPVA
jgi:hypothetical protein